MNFKYSLLPLWKKEDRIYRAISRIEVKSTKTLDNVNIKLEETPPQFVSRLLKSFSGKLYRYTVFVYRFINGRRLLKIRLTCISSSLFYCLGSLFHYFFSLLVVRRMPSIKLLVFNLRRLKLQSLKVICIRISVKILLLASSWRDPREKSELFDEKIHILVENSVSNSELSIIKISGAQAYIILLNISVTIEKLLFIKNCSHPFSKPSMLSPYVLLRNLMDT